MILYFGIFVCFANKSQDIEVKENYNTFVLTFNEIALMIHYTQFNIFII
jgi:hypothetical protein